MILLMLVMHAESKVMIRCELDDDDDDYDDTIMMMMFTTDADDNF